MGWTANDQPAGTMGGNNNIEAIEIQLVPKGGAAPGDTAGAFIEFTPSTPVEPQNPSVSTSVQPGLRTVKNFLLTALEPVGQTVYVFGGGWNEADDGAGPGAVHIGVYPAWKEFFDHQDASYDYNTTKFQINNGLDCSGYVGWAVYNTLNNQNNLAGEVYWADDQAGWFASKGYGTSSSAGPDSDFKPGDIVSMSSGHVYICLGKCEDGSMVIAHSSPPGVMITGLSVEGQDSQAKQLAHAYMSKYYPEYYNRYNNQIDRYSSDYLDGIEKFSWGSNFVGDPDGIRNLSAPEVLKVLFNEI